MATCSGAGDWDKEFTIQSMCKPFAFQMALEQCGLEETLKHVGVEPSGDAFNSIELDAKTIPAIQPDDQRGGDRHLIAHQEVAG